ncbi:hypothetical protein CR513_33487, partial [Mucuna pruriens]
SVCTQPRPSRIVSAEIISALSLSRATRPVAEEKITHITYASSPHSCSIPSVVHGASMRRLVDRGAVFSMSLENNDRTLKELAMPDVGDMKRIFLEKFFSASRTATIRKEICGIRQHVGETLHKYWERFNKLCATSPNQINEQLLI